MRQNRRNVLRALGGLGTLSAIPTVVQADSQPKIVGFTRPLSNPLSDEKAVQLQRTVLRNWGVEGIVNAPDTAPDEHVVGLAFAANAEGQTASYVGILEEGDGHLVPGIHRSVREFKREVDRRGI